MSTVHYDKEMYALISNIPKIYRSYHLRSFFSLFVESGGFVCFHYIHRPELEKPFKSSSGDRRRCASMCCIVKVIADRVHKLIETYNGQNWLDGNGEALPTCCFIKEIMLSDNGKSIHGVYRRAIPKHLPADFEKFSIQEVESLSEMHPPSFMPNGNVGTTIDKLLNKIHMHRLPMRLIRILIRQFPSSWAKRFYDSVAYDYESKKGRRKSKNNHFESRNFLEPSFHNSFWHTQLPGEYPHWENRDYKEIPYYPEEAEWDPYEALYDDVYDQERYFDERIGLNRENGGSDWVFYPDAQNWYAREGYFDEKTSNDRVIDPRIYEEQDYRWTVPKHLPTNREEYSTQYVKPVPEMHPPSFIRNGYAGTNTDYFLREIPLCRLPLQVIHKVGPKFPGSQSRGIYSNVTFDYNSMSRLTLKSIHEEPGIDNDKDIRDLVKRKIKKRQKNDRVEVVNRYEFAGFEKYNKFLLQGIGSKILEAQGWKQGQGIGKNGDGIAEPLPNKGQSNKKGFGYHAIQLGCPPHKKRCGQSDFEVEEKAVPASTINDAPQECVLALISDAKLKYQQKFLKETM